jgi:hypothetical protein
MSFQNSWKRSVLIAALLFMCYCFRNTNNMPMLGVMFQADPEKAAASLAGVFLELLLQKDCYLRYHTC